MKAVKSEKIVRNLIIFTVVVALCGWLGVLVDSQIITQEETPGMLIWLVMPLLAAVLLRVFAGSGWRDAGFLPKIKGNIKWYAISIFVFPIVTIVVVGIGYTIGWIDVAVFDVRIFFSAFVALLGINFVINFFEQSVWMGFLTVKLLKTGIHDIWLYILVGGVIWGFLWHLPYWLVFLPIEDIHSILPMSRLTFSFWGSAVMICWAVMFIEIFRRTGSIWPSVLCHMVEDALFEALLLEGQISIVHGREILISPWMGAISAVIYLLIGLIIRHTRINSSK